MNKVNEFHVFPDSLKDMFEIIESVKEVIFVHKNMPVVFIPVVVFLPEELSKTLTPIYG